MADDGFEALITSLNQSMNDLEEELGDTRTQLDQIIERLPEEFIPREEADVKAGVIRKWFAVVILAGVIVAASAFTGWTINNRAAQKSLTNCEETRDGFRQTIEDVFPLNDPRREKLLANKATRPELCR